MYKWGADGKEFNVPSHVEVRITPQGMNTKVSYVWIWFNVADTNERVRDLVEMRVKMTVEEVMKKLADIVESSIYGLNCAGFSVSGVEWILLIPKGDL